MARIDVLPSIDIIRGFKGILDFYLWRGLPCVRAWPTWRPTRQSDASKAAALLFGAVIKAFSLTHSAALDQLTPELVGIPRTARDLYVSGVYGNLHEASMSDFLDLLTECRDFLSALTALLNALDSIDTDELVVNVDQSVLPPSAATDAHQLTQITALQKLDDLQDALESAGLDRLLVRGSDQLFSFKTTLRSTRAAVISGANGFIASHAVPAGEIWCVTNVAANDTTTATTRHRYGIWDGIDTFRFGNTVTALPANTYTFWSGFKYLLPTHVIRAEFTGGLIADNCFIILTGFIMTLET